MKAVHINQSIKQLFWFIHLLVARLRLFVQTMEYSDHKNKYEWIFLNVLHFIETVLIPIWCICISHPILTLAERSRNMIIKIYSIIILICLCPVCVCLLSNKQPSIQLVYLVDQNGKTHAYGNSFYNAGLTLVTNGVCCSLAICSSHLALVHTERRPYIWHQSDGNIFGHI